ncbi:LysR family transcriptional regulator [Bailinhaonella thermotolerans]|uniref:LysR family transcriptional regulator n=1 Tax=Bailinhaonella thermotolerans TaxID=1070861 RepID=A0A3A4B0A9_9ACTN|nr:LysR substrate-binding domain-containing protein [Bailinhaonella thermotolerans]RJL30890.1 LysR family transcriptional regulator [Bailinhaonella thermotolerans]
MIDVRRLAVLREVARHGSFNRAAAALRFTPSAVSQQVAALERGLGTTVVERSTRGVTLTEPGRLLVEAAEAIDAELADARERIDRLSSARERLTIAAFASGGRILLPPALGRFAAAHPEVELTILEREPEDALPLVAQGRADLALAYHFDGPPPSRPGDRARFDWTPLRRDPLRAVLPSTHPLAARDSLHLAELAEERWILGCLKTNDLLARYAHLAGFELTVACGATDYFFAQALVTAGVGVALIPEIALSPDPALTAVPLEAPSPSRFIGVATPRRPGPLHPYVDELRALLTAP